jgi:peptide/nickel transport system substrate-binding protein
VIQAGLVGGGSIVAGAIIAACGGGAAPAPTAAPTQAPAAAPATATSAPATAAPTAAAATPTTAAAAAATPTTAAATTPTAAAASPTAAAQATTTAIKVVNGQISAGGVVPTPRNQTVVIDQVLFHVFDSFNPFIPNGQEYEAGFQQVCKEFLFYANYAAGKIQPWLATGWKYNSDFTQLTITLDPKAHWNDGKPMTSSDLKFSIEMMQKNDALLGGTDIRTFVDSVTTSDAQTTVIKLKTPNPRFHYNFICGIVGGFEIVPEHIWSSQDPTTFKDNPPVRSGPYILDRVIPDQFMFVWKKDPNYWNKANLDPQPQYVVYRTGPVMDSAVEEFKRAQTDLAGLDYTHMKSISDGGYKNIAIETAFRDPCPRGIWINSDPSKGILSDPRMHWAMSYLVDRQKIGSTIWLINTPPAQYPWADYKSNSQWENSSIADKYALTYDPKKAAALLDQIGATAGSDGTRSFQGKPVAFEIMTPTNVGDPEYEIGQSIADEFKKLGVNVTVRSYQNPVWTQKWNNGDFDVSSHWLCGVSFDPDQLYTQLESDKTAPIGKTAVNGNQIRLQDATFTADAKKLDVVDPTAASSKDLFDAALTDYMKDLPAIPVIQTTYPTAFNTTYWTNWPTDDNLYQVPANWWGQFLFVIGSIKPTGQS